MVKKCKWQKLDFVSDKPTLLELDQTQLDVACAYAIKRIANKFWHKQRMEISKIIGALNTVVKIKHPRFCLKTTRKNITRRKL